MCDIESISLLYVIYVYCMYIVLCEIEIFFINIKILHTITSKS